MHKLLQLFKEQSHNYRVKELGDGTHDFTKKVLEQVFGLAPKSSLVQETNLFGEALYDNFYKYEGSKRTGDHARRDFKCKINGQIVVVETEKLDNIEAGMNQIGGYMKKEDTNYGIVTDGGIWRFFKQGPDHLSTYETKSIDELCSTDGEAFLQNFYNTYDFYLNRLESVESKPFDTSIFHQGLITTAERVVFDLRHIGLFKESTNETDEQTMKRNKEEIQTAYSLIIQLLLIKIIEDKRNLNLLKKEVIISQLKNQDWQAIFESVEGQIKWLGDFYTPYHNQQDTLLNKIISHYQGQSRFAKLTLDSVRLFLDLYHFIYSFNFKGAKQDLFGAVYENYLKELYKDDDTKKGQVFTPPEIVEFMLDEVGYTTDYIEKIVKDNIVSLKYNKDKNHFTIDGLSLIDPACGSGTFLYKAAGRIVNAIHNVKENDKILTDEEAGKIAELLICNNIVGFDIEPFPLYLAEMNILQSLLFFNVSKTGAIINTIDHPIKIFSTQDSIAEFHNLEASMENDLQDLIQGRELHSLASKRDPKSILQLKADLQDFDKQKLILKFQLAVYHQELQSPFYVVDDTLLKTKSTTYRAKHHKKVLTLTTIPTLLDYLSDTMGEAYFGLFKKNMKAKQAQIDHIKTELDKIFDKQQTKRTKFDFVLANPPYIAYNSIPKEVRENWKKIDINMNDVFGVGLHSIPGIRKPYSPKPNLYHYFGALSYLLAKQDGRVCFITPEGFVGYDCMCHFLSESVDLQKLYFFNTKVFIERGINGHMDVCTSAIIFTYQKNNNKSDIILKSYTGNDKEKNINSIMDFMKDNSNNKIIKKSFLPKYVATGFSIFKQDISILKFLDNYKTNSDDLSIYYEHSNTKKPVKENFYFDIGYLLDESLYTQNQGDLYHLFMGSGKYISILESSNYPKDKNNIGLMQANQGYSLLDSKYKIVWNKFMNKGYMFYFEDREIIWATSGRYGIGSDNKEEVLYLFGILNSATTQQVLKSTDTSGEVEAFRVTNQKIKEQIRVPLLNTPAKIAFKSDLIINSEAIVNLCKNGATSGPQTRGDICCTRLDMDMGREVITGIKDTYLPLLKGYSVDENLDPTKLLPNDVLELLKSTNSDLEKLEKERDEIVEKLYNLS